MYTIHVLYPMHGEVYNYLRMCAIRVLDVHGWQAEEDGRLYASACQFRGVMSRDSSSQDW